MHMTSLHNAHKPMLCNAGIDRNKFLARTISVLVYI
jgi:hypothetical protein